MEQLKFEFSVI